MSISSYTDWDYPVRFIAEDYKGVDIVRWYGTIESQLVKMLESADSKKNRVYSDKINEFLKIWRSNPITGSINIETIKPLGVAASILAVDNWDHATYFRSLRDSLNMVIASEEQLPRGGDPSQNDKMRGLGGGLGSGGVNNPAYGPEDDEGPDLSSSENPDDTGDLPDIDNLSNELESDTDTKQYDL